MPRATTKKITPENTVKEIKNLKSYPTRYLFSKKAAVIRKRVGKKQKAK